MKDFQIGIPCGPNSEKFANFLIKSAEKTISGKKTYSYLIAINKPGVKREEITNGITAEVNFVERHSQYTSSEGHADALNLLLENIESDFAFFVDSDVAFLCKDWDSILLDHLIDGTAMIGTEYHHSDGKMSNRPNVITCAFSVKTLKSLDVNFMPSLKNIVLRADNCSHFGRKEGDTIFMDTGCDMISSLVSAGHETKVLKIVSPRYPDTHKDLLFLKRSDRGEEYHLEGVPICTHIGRSLTRNFDNDIIVKNWKRNVTEWLDGKV